MPHGSPHGQAVKNRKNEFLFYCAFKVHASIDLKPSHEAPSKRFPTSQQHNAENHAFHSQFLKVPKDPNIECAAVSMAIVSKVA